MSHGATRAVTNLRQDAKEGFKPPLALSHEKKDASFVVSDLTALPRLPGKTTVIPPRGVWGKTPPALPASHTGKPPHSTLQVGGEAGPPVKRETTERSEAASLACMLTCFAAGVDWPTSRPKRLLDENRPLAELKELSAEARSSWILNGAGDQSAQMSFLGRALPKGDAASRNAALEQHRLDLTSVHRTTRVVLSAATSFAEKWARRKVARSKFPLGNPDWPTSSSCLERGTGKGGLLGYLSNSFDKCPSPPSTPSEAFEEDRRYSTHLIKTALGRWDRDILPSHRVSALSERGLKTRVVTVGPTHVQVLGHTVRKRMLNALRHTEGTYAPLSGATDDEIEKIFVGSTSSTMVSTDLTRASDLLPLDLVSAIVDGLSASGKFSHLEIEVLRLCTGPQRVTYPDGRDVVTSRGILMGVPTTWVVLSLIHLFWLDQVSVVDPVRERATKFAICGDDALVACSPLGAHTYKRLVNLCGGAPSKGKHYESTGLLRGVFLERLYQFGHESGRITRVERHGAISIRGLTASGPPREFCGSDIISVKSKGIRLLTTLDALDSSPANRPFLERVVSTGFRWFPAFARNVLGLRPGRPHRVGGFVVGTQDPVDEEWCQVNADSGLNLSATLRRVIEPKWTVAAAYSKKVRSAFHGIEPKLFLEGDEPDIDNASPTDYLASLKEREVGLTLPMFRALRVRDPLSKPKILYLKVSAYQRALRLMQEEGLKRPTGLPSLVPRRYLARYRIPTSALVMAGIPLMTAHKLGRGPRVDLKPRLRCLLCDWGIGWIPSLQPPSDLDWSDLQGEYLLNK